MIAIFNKQLSSKLFQKDFVRAPTRNAWNSPPGMLTKIPNFTDIFFGIFKLTGPTKNYVLVFSEEGVKEMMETRRSTILLQWYLANALKSPLVSTDWSEVQKGWDVRLVRIDESNFQNTISIVHFSVDRQRIFQEGSRFNEMALLIWCTVTSCRPNCRSFTVLNKPHKT